MSCVAHRALQPFADDPQQLVAGRVPEVVVDVLEAVDVDEQRPGDDPRLARGAREHLLGAVEHERAVGQPGEGVVQGLVGELARLLVHERQRPPRPVASTSTSSPSTRSTACPPISSMSACEFANTLPRRRRREALHGPAVVQADLAL